MIPKEQVIKLKQEAAHHLREELLPFWLERCLDEKYGGFITHFDEKGNDTGEDQKTLVAQTRLTYSMSAAHRAGYGDGKCGEFARHGVDFLLEKMWDEKYGGFFWSVDRKGNIQIDKKILYGLSFAIYALSEYTLATGDNRGIEYARKTFDLIQKYATDTMYGGYFEMFERNWDLCGPESGGGNRKTLDVHMHLMESFSSLYECSQEAIHRRKLQEVIQILVKRILHPKYGTGIPQFWQDWRVAPQIKFDIIWGWDRFEETGEKSHGENNTSYGHNAELSWLLWHALDVLGETDEPYKDVFRKLIDHAVQYGIDEEFGGVYVEGSHSGEVYDREKEFWQQAEMMIGLLEAYLRFKDEKYWHAYENVHRFVFDKVIDHEVGEWIPLLTREGEPIWTHKGHSWKINYHTIRGMIEVISHLEKIIESLD